MKRQGEDGKQRVWRTKQESSQNRLQLILDAESLENMYDTSKLFVRDRRQRAAMEFSYY